MKNMLKKLTAFIAVATMSVGVCTTPVSADELQNEFTEEIHESNYYICDELLEQDFDIEDTLNKIKLMYENGEISSETADDWINTWSLQTARASTTYYSNDANDFFVAVNVNVGTRIFTQDTVDIYFHTTNEGDTPSFLYDATANGDIATNVVIGNAVPTLTSNNIFSHETTNGGYTLFLNNCIASENGYLLKFKIKLQSNWGWEIKGSPAYGKLENSITVGGNKILSDTTYKHIGSLGDLNRDGEVNISDKQILLNYLINETTLNYIQMAAADVNEDGKIDIRDTSRMEQFITGSHSSFHEN